METSKDGDSNDIPDLQFEMDENRVARPFKTLQELYDNVNNLKPWPKIQRLRERTDFVFSGQEIVNGVPNLTRLNRWEKSKTLVCHDMMGGYLADRFIDGTDTKDAYVFYHWSLIDTFVYFSHHLITIPPYGWINAAHIHGVKILGTIITERLDGKNVWKEVLKSLETIHKFADALIDVAKFYEFEGWLLNIENTIESSDVDKVLYFVKYLTDNIHERIEGSQIIWYDSVTKTGKLSWQNALNENNQDFFLNCDGIYLNYNWTPKLIEDSIEHAINLNRDPKNIYVGIDVWGRGTFGGGRFDSKVALAELRGKKLPSGQEIDMSVAFFAPGWTHEFFQVKDVKHYTEDVFWTQLFPYLYVHVLIHDNETFKTSFCRGIGEKCYVNGTIPYAKEKPFFNLSDQQLQPSVVSPYLEFNQVIQKNSADSNIAPVVIYETTRCTVTVQQKDISFKPAHNVKDLDINYFEYSNDCAYNGGGCLKVFIGNPNTVNRLFLVHLDFSHEIQATIIYKHTTNLFTEEPIIILNVANRNEQKSLVSVGTFQLENDWKKKIYMTNMRTINEIGVTLKSRGTFHIGEMIFEQKFQLNSNNFGTDLL